MLKEPVFGGSGYRFHGEFTHDYGYYRIYSIFDPDTVKQLSDQLSKIEPYLACLPDDGDG